VSEPSIRDATAADAAALARLLAELGYPASEREASEHVARFAADPASRVQVAEVAGRVVGLVATHLVPRFDDELLSCRVMDIVVAVDQRRSGVGRALMAAAEREARRGGATRVDLSSGFERDDAQAFYRALGYESRSRNFAKRLA
jgi:N-acetylglutamate synthase-like GNAT family acetyltransferase